MAGGCALFCAVNAAVGIPFLAYLGFLCNMDAIQIDVPSPQKPQAAQGCFVAAAMYAVTFLLAVFYFNKGTKSASAREVTIAHGGGSYNRVAVSEANY